MAASRAAAAAAVSHLTSTPTTTPASRAAHPSSFKPQPCTTTTSSGAWSASFQARRRRTAGAARVTCMAAASYTVTFRTPAGDKVVQAPEDAYLLDTAEEAGLDLPYSCRAGACCSCVARIVGQGAVDQSDGSYLDDDQKSAGYVLTCIAYPTSDLVIETHKEADM